MQYFDANNENYKNLRILVITVVIKMQASVIFPLAREEVLGKRRSPGECSIAANCCW